MTLTQEQINDIAVNRAAYEALKSEAQGATPHALPPLTPKERVALPAEDVVAAERVPGGWYWYGRLARGETVRLVNATGRSSASIIAWNAHDPSERINHADTVKVQWTAALRKGRVVLSDMGKVMVSITEDSIGRTMRSWAVPRPGATRGNTAATIAIRATISFSAPPNSVWPGPTSPWP